MGFIKRLGKLWALGILECFGMALFSFVVTDLVSDITKVDYDMLYVGLTLAFTIAILAPSTGGHVNPAVTTCLALNGFIGPDRVTGFGEIMIMLTQSVLYILFQIFGAVSGGLFARWFNGSLSEGATLTFLQDIIEANDNNYMKFIIAEMIGTLLLCYTVTCLVYRGAFGDMGPLLVGLSVYIMGGAIGQWSGGMYNCGITMGLVGSAIIMMTPEYKETDIFGNAAYVFGLKIMGIAIASQLCGALLACLMSIFTQFAKRRNEVVGTAQMNVGGAAVLERESSSTSSDIVVVPTTDKAPIFRGDRPGESSFRDGSTEYV